ncbi:ATP phosphoribosyltransferase regulatory subunit [Acidovorax sp. GBBC 3334]|uniref:ATP phosphoribosyltransferase regulatory subunit n=1 Tax=Acidovorax sp. GBBC 3334 TaxID=2940496 RepID=UPI002302CD95|nr:ATP phosphoribosyltransferase regulatory subunit [Acidovorax sp. GBBC 3334]MDA8457471.1 ATP phosphoribosyltransferase regulatory subunit [Acidovorax sp. GBBC 3334]
MSAWVLPDHIADVLPSEARHIEQLRREFIDTAERYGYELVMPPLIEHLESLLSGTGEALDLQTFKLIDQLSGKSLGLRADITQQVARIDAHLLNRLGVTRLCYCGPVVHTRPDRPRASREPLQFGAEIYGHSGIEADLEALMLALNCLKSAGVKDINVDLTDVRIVQSIVNSVSPEVEVIRKIYGALAKKDASELVEASTELSVHVKDALLAILRYYGDEVVFLELQKALTHFDGALEVLENLRSIASHLKGYAVSFDFSDMRGYSYYSGTRFTLYAKGWTDALVRGGRYDEVGAAFGRTRPAVGFSLDIKQLVNPAGSRAQKKAIKAPWSSSGELNEIISSLRSAGETVVCLLPGHDNDVQDFCFDRVLIRKKDGWVVQSLLSN